MAIVSANVADIRPWQLGQRREQLHRPSWVEQMPFSSMFSAALPCSRHYFSPHKMAAKHHRLSWHCRFKAGPPLEAILVIFGRRALIFFFCLKALGKKWKMTPLLCACAVVITLETQKCRKRAPHSVEFNFFNNCDRQKRFSQNERRRAGLQKVASDFLIFALGLSYDLSKFSDDFTPFFRLWKTITKSLGKN